MIRRLPVFAGTQLTVLTEGVLTEEGAFTDYTDTDGKWMTEKSNGDTIDQTVWTRYHMLVYFLPSVVAAGRVVAVLLHFVLVGWHIRAIWGARGRLLDTAFVFVSRICLVG